jgi:alkanesulfonate monooxygenase SsuD/methylene tetrahydromethanopterin reductase-like flavin-dependent oxidoreductase (luciferase family)
MRIGLDVAQQRMPWSEVASRAQFADEAGFDGIWGFDHFQPMYGSGPGECFEGNTTLAALSGLTKRARLGLLVTGLTYRHPSVLAAEAITIDHASGGRYELAYGAAWFDGEHRALGIPFPPTGERVAAFEEAVQVVRGLLTTDRFSFDGRHYQVREATLRPRPVQQPRPPIWIGASGDRMLGVAARHADVWHSFGPPDHLAERSERLSELAAAAGRDPAAILRAGSLSLDRGVDDARRTIDRWQEVGFGYLVAGWPSEGQPTVEAFAAAVLG